jgi:hypothetical protein
VSTLTLDKSHATFNAPATIRCQLNQANNSILTVNSLVTVLGNHNLTQGNVTATGQGYLDVRGCFTGSSGSMNGYITGNITVCVQQNSTAGPGCAGGSCQSTGISASQNAANCQIIASLPVRLLYFDAKYQSSTQRVLLEWVTTWEENSDYFSVERSGDGKVFEPVAYVKALGNSTARHTYTAVDERPLPQVSYYRLKQVDIDGTFEYFKLVAVHGPDAPPAARLDAHPNPNYGKFTLTYPADATDLWITDTKGRTIVHTPIRPAGGSTREQPVDLSAEAGGVYIVQVKSPQQMLSRKIVLVK